MIEKNGTTYSVKENAKSWTVTRVEDRITISYNIDKELCDTYESLCEYVTSNDLF